MVRLEPNHLDGLFNLGVIYLREGNYKNSVDLFKHLLDIDNENAGARTNLALCFRKLGYFKEAIQQSLKLVKHHPNSIEVLSNLAYSYYAIEDYDQATQYFIEMAEIDPTQVDAHVYLSMIFLINQDIESCVASCDNLLKLLNLRRDLTLHSLEHLADRFFGIAKKLGVIKKFHLSNICQEIGKILASH